MFDKLVESEPGGRVRSRSKYFVASTLAMSFISLTAVVVSIFADDYSLNTSIELTELVSRVEIVQVAPEQAQPRQSLTRTQQSTLPTREIAIARVDDTRWVPTAISTTLSSHLAIPDDGRFKLGPRDSNPAGQGGDSSRGISRGGVIGDGNGLRGPTVAMTSQEESDPPLARRPATPKPSQSGGVLNGKAVRLPVPNYPTAARAVGAQGQVTVQVILDETGNVISVIAVSGNPLLRGAAVEAARRAKFTPTYLSHMPVKVTGVIIYNFNRG